MVPTVGFTVCAQKQSMCTHTLLHLGHLILAANMVYHFLLSVLVEAQSFYFILNVDLVMMQWLDQG